MAEDTQQTDASQQSSLPINKETLTVHPENKPFTGAQWQWQNGQVRPYQPPENANLMPGGTQHTAGGKDLEVSLRNAFPKGLSWSDFVELPKRPCVRDALLQGIGAGFAAGGLRALWRGTVMSVCSWAIGGFCVTASVSRQYCLYRRQAEKDGMMRAMEIINQKELERHARDAQKERAREEKRLAKERAEEQAREAELAALREGGGGKLCWRFW